MFILLPTDVTLPYTRHGHSDRIISSHTLARATVNLIFNIKDYQVTHGMLLKYGSDAHSINAIPVGVSLFPSLFPECLFEEARELQAVYNKLYARVAEDEE